MLQLYFDYNATTPLAPQVKEILIESLSADYKNPSSAHREGRLAKRKIDESREKIAFLLGCQEEEIVFTSGATEGNNAVLHLVGEQNKRKTIVTTETEHDSVLKPLEFLKTKGFQVKTVYVNSKGETDLNEWKKLIDDQTALVSLMAVNNETGFIFPVQEVAEIAHNKGALFHTDSACAVGKIPLSFSQIDADFLTLSACKCYGPKGMGALIIKKGAPFIPWFKGGAHERGRRAGTLNVSGIAGLALALDFSLSDLKQETERQKRLRDKLKTGLKNIDRNVIFHESDHQLPGTLHLAFPGLLGHTLLANLDLEGVSASFGSACQSGSLEVSRVLLAMGVDEKEAAGSIRLSFGRMTTEGEIEDLLKVFETVLRRMQT